MPLDCSSSHLLRNGQRWSPGTNFRSFQQQAGTAPRVCVWNSTLGVPWLWKMQVSDWYPRIPRLKLSPTPTPRQDLPRFREIGFQLLGLSGLVPPFYEPVLRLRSSQPILSKRKKKFPSNSVLYSLICLSSSDSLLWIINFYMVWLQLSSAAFCLVPSSPCRASQCLACTYCVLCWGLAALSSPGPAPRGPWTVKLMPET